MKSTYGMHLGKRTKKSVSFNDEVSDLLEAFAADPLVISRVVGSAALRLKNHAREVNARTFPKITGGYCKSIWFKQYKRSARATLGGGNLSSIYEHNGAFIQPMKGEALKFVINGKTIFYKGVIRIEPKPWFYHAMEEAYQRGYVDQAAMQQIQKEIKERNLG